MAGKFEIYQDKAGKHRFRLVSGKGDFLLCGEAYETKASCENGS